MESILENLASYGPLGLWTASLLWMNIQQKSDNKEREEKTLQAFTEYQRDLKAMLMEHKVIFIKLEDALEDLKEEVKKHPQ
jgi:predicted RNase H-like nuclease (RuvC/YqgF family)